MKNKRSLGGQNFEVKDCKKEGATDRRKERECGRIHRNINIVAKASVLTPAALA